MNRAPRLLLSAISIAALAAGCSDDAPGGIDAAADAGTDGANPDAPGYYATLPTELNRDVDVLFVVDNSGSMLAEQQQLAVNFPVFINVLQQVAGGLPNLHVGVVSSNAGGAGQAGVPGCEGQGDDGFLLTGPEGNTCATQFGLQGTFISDIAQANGTRLTNYNPGTLPELFSCMAQLGTFGCGFEQHLESMYRSLQPGKNPGFLRADAHLAVVFLADEDDCSTQDGTMFGDPNANIVSQLGPRTSFRCFEFGVQCENDPNPRVFGPKTHCVPRANSPYMYGVQRYVDFLRSLKGGTAEVVVAGILGDFDAAAGDVSIGPDLNNPTFPSVQRSCFVRDPNDPDDGAAPPVRLASFLAGFDHNVRTTICNANLGEAMVEIGTQIKKAVGNPCIDANLTDADAQIPGLQPTCTVKDVGPSGNEIAIPACTTVIQAGVEACDPGPAGTPCWCLVQDPQSCPSTPSNLALSIARGGATPPSGTVTELYCQAD